MQSLAALCVAKLVDTGHVKYTSLVTDYWPEFGAHGKDNVTVEMLASHQAGLAAIDQPITIGVCVCALGKKQSSDDVRSQSRMSKLFEEQTPNWAPNEYAFGYHAITYGMLLSQLVQRVDSKHRTVPQYFADEILVGTGKLIHDK